MKSCKIHLNVIATKDGRPNWVQIENKRFITSGKRLNSREFGLVATINSWIQEQRKGARNGNY